MPIVESKEAANYTDDGSPAEHCGICEHYRRYGTTEDGTCTIVSGVVKYRGWCRHYYHVHEAA